MQMWKALPLVAILAVAAPAGATVGLVSIGANSLTNETIGSSNTFKSGPNAVSLTFDDPYMVSTSDQTDEYHFAQIKSSAAGAVRLNALDDINFLVRASVNADSLPFQVGTHAISSASAYYSFTLDTVSVLDFSISTVPVSASDTSYVTADLFSTNEYGEPVTYYREGYAAGRIAPSYTLDPGTYTFIVSAYGEGGTPDNSRFNGYAAISTLAVVDLSINSPSASPVPEPASWAMMIAGFGAIGAVSRRRNYLLRAA